MTDFNTDIELFDDGPFPVYKTRWGTYASRDKDGNGICSGLDKDSVCFWTREHLNGFENSWASTTNVSMIGDALK